MMMASKEDNPFAQEYWELELASIISEHEVDQATGVDAQLVADFLATTAGALARLIRQRDATQPKALDAEERAELEALRQGIKDRDAIIARRIGQVEDLNLIVADLQRQRGHN